MPKREAVENTSKKRGNPQKVAPKEAAKDIVVREGEASVSYHISITKNMGNYESIKVDAGLTVPYGASKELLDELDKLLVTTREKVVARLAKDIVDITNSLT